MAKYYLNICEVEMLSRLLQTVIISCLAGTLFACSGGKSETKETESGSRGTTPPPAADEAPLTVAISSEISGSTELPQANISVKFSKAVTGFSVSDIVSTGSVSNFSGSGSSYSFTLDLISTGVNTVNIPAGAAQDSNGNLSEAASEFSFTYAPAPSTAQLTGQPPAQTTGTTIDLDVSGGDVANYEYKVGPAATTDCADSPGYTGPVASTTNITYDSSSEGDGDFVVCIVGIDSGGNAQPYSNATRYTWTVDTQAPTISGLSDDNSGYQLSKTWTWSCSEECTYDVVVDQNAGTDPSGTYAPANSRVHNSGEGRYYLHVQAKDPAGNESALVHVYADIDAVAPTAPASVNDGSLTNSATTTPTITWPVGSDAGSGVTTYEYMIETTAGFQLAGWTVDADRSVQHTGLSMTDGASYRVQVRAVDGVGNVSAPVISDGWLVDLTNPTAVSNLLDNAGDGTLSVSPTFSWDAASDASGIDHYELAIGTTSGGAEVLSWTNIGAVTSYQRSGLSLTDGTTYYASIRAVDAAGNTGSAVTSAGWVANATAENNYFVLSKDVFDGNLGGLSGADSTCLNQLQNNDWMGKGSTTLNASTVKAFLCSNSSCKNLLPNTEYTFARAGSPAIGGATFTTNSAGRGPGNSVAWNTSSTFGTGGVSYWMGREALFSDTLWATVKGSSETCENWTSVDVFDDAEVGSSNHSDSRRWGGPWGNCDEAFYLICVVESP